MIDDFNLMLLLVNVIHRRTKKRDSITSSVHTRYQKKYLKQLRSLQRRLRQRRIPRASLLDPRQSAWFTLFESGNDQTLITLTGFDFNTFRWLSERFTPLYTTHSPFVDPDGRSFFLVPTIHDKRTKEIAQDCYPRMIVWACALLGLEQEVQIWSFRSYLA
jgi:hypothetical protein